ncbi:MAG: hypothetical protein F6K30_01205 [Cyanothece sp. SIO2G6]|nr:hypothetical protein [Cyanothece sp. SIO2G6]
MTAIPPNPKCDRPATLQARSPIYRLWLHDERDRHQIRMVLDCVKWKRATGNVQLNTDGFGARGGDRYFEIIIQMHAGFHASTHPTRAIALDDGRDRLLPVRFY